MGVSVRSSSKASERHCLRKTKIRTEECPKGGHSSIQVKGGDAMAEKADWTVGGFQFGTEKDAALAKGEQIRIEHIETKLDYNNMEMVNAVYKKAIDNRVFKTPVGYVFLRRLQEILKEHVQKEPALDETVEEIPDIPIFGVYSLRESTNSVVERVKASKKKPEKKAPPKEFFSRRTSIIVNIALLALIVVMFAISFTGTSPTVLNYEATIQNKYSHWEQELSEREAVIREKEKELLISE